MSDTMDEIIHIVKSKQVVYNVQNITKGWPSLIVQLITFMDVKVTLCQLNSKSIVIPIIDILELLVDIKNTYDTYAEIKDDDVLACFDHHISIFKKNACINVDINKIPNMHIELLKSWNEYIISKKIDIVEIATRLRRCVLDGIINNKSVENIQESYDNIYEPYRKAQTEFLQNNINGPSTSSKNFEIFKHS